jgi:hypothetical protein
LLLLASSIFKFDAFELSDNLGFLVFYCTDLPDISTPYLNSLSFVKSVTLFSSPLQHLLLTHVATPATIQQERHTIKLPPTMAMMSAFVPSSPFQFYAYILSRSYTKVSGEGVKLSTQYLNSKSVIV